MCGGMSKTPPWTCPRVRLANPIELLRGGQVGEREPKTRWLTTVIGVAALGAGYAIALTTVDPYSAIAFYFLAVLLVIIGTYCLFTAGSIALLKLLRKNKRYYYQTGCQPGRTAGSPCTLVPAVPSFS